MERCETPVFEGGTSQEIVFQEVISNSATEQEPLGALAGRGVTTNRQRGGHIKIKVTEPGYIMCICSITPRIDYSQGNQWDTEIKTNSSKPLVCNALRPMFDKQVEMFVVDVPSF